MTEHNFTAGQAMKELTEDDLAGLPYSAGHILKNCPISRTSPEFVKLFGNITQALWHFRKHPEFLGYSGSEEIKAINTLGLDTIDEVDLKKEIDEKWNLNTPLTGLIYLPKSDDKVPIGILTDLVRAYKEFGMKIPYGKELDDVLQEDRQFFQSRMILDTTIPLYIAGHIIPHIDERFMHDSDYFYWNPSKLIDADYKSYAQRLGIRNLDDKVGFAVELVRHCPQINLDRFRKSVAK